MILAVPAGASAQGRYRVLEAVDPFEVGGGHILDAAIDPGGHSTLRLRRGGRTKGELELSDAWRTDERDGLAGDKSATNDTIE